MNTESGYTCTITASGNADFIREVAVPFAGAIEKLLPSHTGNIPLPLRISRTVQNSTTVVIALGITVYVANHFTKKVMDDVYTLIIQPRLKLFLEKISQKLTRGRVKKSYNTSIWYEELNTLVSVTIVGNSFEEILKQSHLVPDVHSNALSWIAKNGIQKPIHHYKIENGQVNATPILADSIQELIN